MKRKRLKLPYPKGNSMLYSRYIKYDGVGQRSERKISLRCWHFNRTDTYCPDCGFTFKIGKTG